MRAGFQDVSHMGLLRYVQRASVHLALHHDDTTILFDGFLLLF